MQANKLSKTAAFVAIKFYGLTRDDQFRSLFDPSVIEFYDKLVQSLPSPLSYYHYWLQYPWVRTCYIWGEELLLPGDLLHIIARKWYIQQITQQLVDDGYKQIIILGAGFDHLGYYFSQQGLSCIEIETSHMAYFKRQFLQEQYSGQNHPSIVSHRTSTNRPLPKIADQSNIDSQLKTAVISEGFFDYLTADIVTQILDYICSNFSHNTTLVSTHFALDELPFFHRKIFRISVEAVGEKLRLTSSINTFKRMLREQGYSISQFYDAQSIRATLLDRINTEFSILRGFYILSAKVNKRSEIGNYI